MIAAETKRIMQRGSDAKPLAIFVSTRSLRRHMPRRTSRRRKVGIAVPPFF
jgi:hypothetical protein